MKIKSLDEPKVNAEGFMVDSEGKVMTSKVLKPLPERRVKATSRSSSSDSGSGTDWYSDALTPTYLKPVREYSEVPMPAPVEADAVEEAKAEGAVVTTAEHPTAQDMWDERMRE